MSVINTVLKLLVTGKPLPREYKEHSLKGDYIGYLECHGKPDLLLIYKITEQVSQFCMDICPLSIT
ncbi:type II toxin-antitoxin system YafQ family toxin [Photorhabdus stackebrandtii]|uniref:type II toxin-antitoxin system YafQ family toxin n=1 Tax=Photorhabdus stackebrandtii TaxID=1123042 RepID=UPI0030EF893F